MNHDMESMLALAIKISTRTRFIEAQSSVEDEQYVFSYTITIENQSTQSVQLMARRWEITDANGDVTTIEGEGVIGQQPSIPAGKSYTYTSGSIFKTPFGIMQGKYFMKDSQGHPFSVDIPLFKLATPHLLN